MLFLQNKYRLRALVHLGTCSLQVLVSGMCFLQKTVSLITCFSFYYNVSLTIILCWLCNFCVLWYTFKYYLYKLVICLCYGLSPANICISHVIFLYYSLSPAIICTAPVIFIYYDLSPANICTGHVIFFYITACHILIFLSAVLFFYITACHQLIFVPAMSFFYVFTPVISQYLNWSGNVSLSWCFLHPVFRPQNVSLLHTARECWWQVKVIISSWKLSRKR